MSTEPPETTNEPSAGEPPAEPTAIAPSVVRLPPVTVTVPVPSRPTEALAAVTDPPETPSVPVPPSLPTTIPLAAWSMLPPATTSSAPPLTVVPPDWPAVPESVSVPVPSLRSEPVPVIESA